VADSREETNRQSLIVGRWPSPALLVGLAAGAGVVLRLDGLDRKSLWIDEVMTFRSLAMPTVAAMLQDVEASLPSLYFLAIRAWVQAWGLNDVSLRMPSALLGALCLPVTYLVWCPLVGRRAIAWATALLALNAYHVEYSQDGKMYVAIWLLATVSSGAFLRVALRDGPARPAWLVLYGLSTASLPLLSYVGIVPAAIQGLYGLALLRWRPRRRWAVLDAGVVALLALLPSALWALPTAVEASRQNVGISWIPPISPDQVPRELHRFLGVLLLGYRPSGEAPEEPLARLLAAAYAPCLVAAVALLGVSLARVLRVGSPAVAASSPSVSGGHRMAPEVVAYLAVWLVVPVAGAFVFALLVRPIWGPPRYLFGAAPALGLWLGAALAGLRPRTLMTALGIAFLSVNVAMIAFGRVYTTRTPWREVGATIADVAAATNLEDADGLMVASLRGEHEFDRACLAHALNHDPGVPAPVGPAFVTLDQALGRGRPFVIVMVVYMGPTLSGDMRADVERAVPGYACRQLYGRAVFQEPYTSMPTPYMRHSVEVWLCSPTPAPRGAGQATSPWVVPAMRSFRPGTRGPMSAPTAIIPSSLARVRPSTAAPCRTLNLHGRLA